jgi:hypothetical protein
MSKRNTELFYQIIEDFSWRPGENYSDLEKNAQKWADYIENAENLYLETTSGHALYDAFARLRDRWLDVKAAFIEMLWPKRKDISDE